MTDVSKKLQNLVDMEMPIEVAELSVLVEAIGEMKRLRIIETAAKELTANYSASGFAAFADLVRGEQKDAA